MPSYGGQKENKDLSPMVLQYKSEIFPCSVQARGLEPEIGEAAGLES